MDVKLRLTSDNNGKKIVEHISDVDLSATRTNMLDFAQDLSDLSQNQLQKVEKITTEILYDVTPVKVFTPYNGKYVLDIRGIDYYKNFLNDAIITTDVTEFINFGFDVELAAIADNALISNLANRFSIDNSGTRASIDNSGTQATINNSAANVTIDNSGTSASIDNSGMQATISNSAANVTIDNSAADASIDNSGTSASIDNSGSQATISNSAANVTIDNSAADASIDNSGTNVSIDNSGTNVSIDNSGANVTIDNSAADVSIKTGAGADTIHTSGEGTVTIFSGGSDSIKSENTGIVTFQKESGGYSTITGYKGDDIFYMSAATASTISVSGDWSRASVAGFTVTDGSDTFTTGFKMLYQGASEPVLQKAAVKVFESLESGTIDEAGIKVYCRNANTVTSTADNVSIYAAAGANKLTSYGDNATITTASGADTIYLEGNNSTISTGLGNDHIYIGAAADNNTIYGGKANDHIVNPEVTVEEETDETDEPAVTEKKGNIFWYAGNLSEGTDTIENWHAEDHIFIRITGTSVTSAVSGTTTNVTLKSGSYTTYLKITGLNEDDTISVYQGSTGNEKIHKIGTHSFANTGWYTPEAS